MNTNSSFIETLLRFVPQLKPLYDQHMADNNSLLPHLFMGDVTRFAVSEVSNPVNHDVLERILTYLEDGLRNGPEEVKELIVVSFVENLQGESSAVKALKPFMGRYLKQEVEAVCGE